MGGWSGILGAFVAGVVVSTLTTPVGVSGAVFLLPVQLDVLRVPSPQVTPTNLLFNIVAVPGALVRHGTDLLRRDGLVWRLVMWTVPGVVAGAVVRVEVVPDVRPFRLVAGVVLAGVGAFILRPGASSTIELSALPRWLGPLGLVVGLVGGMYGIGGGSIIGPVLVGAGMSVALVAPAALATTWVTSIAGAAAYLMLSIGDRAVGPDWRIGLACGAGGLVGGHLGARLRPRLSEVVLRRLLGFTALVLSVVYVVQSV